MKGVYFPQSGVLVDFPPTGVRSAAVTPCTVVLGGLQGSQTCCSLAEDCKRALLKVSFVLGWLRRDEGLQNI